MKGLFLEVLRLCRECGLVKAGAIALDGTKMKAKLRRISGRFALGTPTFTPVYA
ncbi:MAG: hypothetical protein AAB268_10650 [Elusimicrobiota bacterium]